MLPPTTYRCSKCKEIKPVGEFHRRGDRPKGRHSRCKQCVSVYQVDPTLPKGHLRCSSCRQVQAENQFRFRRYRGAGKTNRRGKGRDSWCVTCRLSAEKAYRDDPKNAEAIRLRQTHWIRNNPEKLRASRKNSDSKKREAMKTWVRAFKSKPCLDCGETYAYYIMHCDHRPGEVKMFDVSQAPTLNLLQLELLKCDAVCANCHAERTQQRRYGDSRA